MGIFDTIKDFFTPEEVKKEREFLKRMVEENRSINTYSSYTNPKLKVEDRNEFIRYLINSTNNIWEDVPKDFAIENNTYLPKERLGQTTGLMGEGLTTANLAAPLAAQVNTSALESTVKNYPNIRKEIEAFTGTPLTLQGLFDQILPHEGRHAEVHNRVPFEYSPNFVSNYFNVSKTNPFWTYTNNAEHMRRVIQDYAKNYPSSHAKKLDLNNEMLYTADYAPFLYDEIATRTGDYGDKIRNLFFIENPKDRQIMENYLRTVHDYWGD